MLILRNGGNFIIKTFAGNVNDLFLSMLELACRSFGEIYYYKSPINFWSHEIYICGKSFNGITPEIKKKLIHMMKTRENVLPQISNEIFDDYFTYSKKIIHTSSIYKKFFVFCADNPEYVKQYDSYIRKIVQSKNDKWAKYFIK
jgi:hypothetical protein